MNDFVISPITREIEPKLPAVATKAFGAGVGLMIPKKHLWGFYAHSGDDIVGAVYIKKIGPVEGCLDWIYVAPAAQGHQLGARLFRAGIDAMIEQGLTTQIALVRGSNTASWSMFAKDGFVRPSVFHTLTKYSLQSLPYRLIYSFASGYNIWVKDPALSIPMHPTRFGLLKTLLFSVIMSVALSLFGLRGIETLLIATTTIVGITALRIGIEYALSRPFGPLRWNAPQGGTLLAIMIALLGSWWPVFGHFSPKADIYRDSDYVKTLGISRFATWMLLVVVYVSAAFFNPSLFQSGYGFLLGFVLAIQLLLPFPFDEFDGARVYAYSKPLYFIGVLITLVSGIVVQLIA
jgi:GNAT superfamily N-acetyltransferase